MKTIAGSLSVLVILCGFGCGKTPNSQSAASKTASSPVYTAWPFDANEAARRQDETAKVLGVEKEVTLKLDANVSMKLVLIPAGKFMMGTPDEVLKDMIRADQKIRAEGYKSMGVLDGPQHGVTIGEPFYMASTTVTQAQYELVMGTNPSYFKEAANPVEQVSWDDAVEFSVKLSGKTGKIVMLPTEAQWEYACRAGTATTFRIGDDLSDLEEYGWYRNNSDMRAHPVAQRKPNPWGLYDMHGNVYQWCSDWYDKDYFELKDQVDPKGPASGSGRVVRGGSFNNVRWVARSDARGKEAVGEQSGTIGFRVVVEIGQNPATTQPARP